MVKGSGRETVHGELGTSDGGGLAQLKVWRGMGVTAVGDVLALETQNGEACCSPWGGTASLEIYCRALPAHVQD